jgi:hypothetical protein
VLVVVVPTVVPAGMVMLVVSEKRAHTLGHIVLRIGREPVHRGDGLKAHGLRKGCERVGTGIAPRELDEAGAKLAGHALAGEESHESKQGERFWGGDDMEFDGAHTLTFKTIFPTC